MLSLDSRDTGEGIQVWESNLISALRLLNWLNRNKENIIRKKMALWKILLIELQWSCRLVECIKKDNSAGHYCSWYKKDGDMDQCFLENSVFILGQSVDTTFLSPYLDSMGTTFLNGANFAIAGSTTLPKNVPFSLNIQVMQFIRFKGRSLQLVAAGDICSRWQEILGS